MKKVPLVITTVTILVLFYQLTPFIGIPDAVIIGLFLLMPILVIYMAYVILKDGKPSTYTFEERFYEDYNYTRNTGRETGDEP